MTDDLMEKVQGLSLPGAHEQAEVLISDTQSMKKKFPEFDWRDFAEKQLFKIASLPPNWNRMGAETPNRNALKYAYDFLNELNKIGIEIPKPIISPTPDGGIQFVWENGDKDLELEFEDSGILHYLFEDEEKQISRELSLYPGEDTQQIQFYLNEMYR